MTKIDIDNLDVSAARILREYGDVVYKATENGLSKAERILIRNLRANSPKNTGTYAKSWKGKGRRFKLKDMCNTKLVRGREGEIPLSNILEYSSKSPHQGLIKDL